MSRDSLRLVLLLAAVLLSALFPSVAPAGGEGRDGRRFDRFIVMFEPGSVERNDARARQRSLEAASRPAGSRPIRSFRLGLGADVVVLDRKLDHKAAQAFMNRLRRQAGVRYVEVDRVLKPMLVPNDTYYYLQWPLFDTLGGVNMPPAWDLATGAGVYVGVVDTGRTAHSEITDLPGYDFISDLAMANDGNGRDADPYDPGDWAAAGVCGPGEPATDSSWHGTLVAGTIVAATNNAKGVAGIAPGAKILPLRTLGRCGGYSSDVADAIRWAVGGTVPGAPANSFIVDVLNLSLAGEGLCGPTMQAAIDQAVAAGTVVVVAAGNAGASASQYEPANCANVVVVGANLRTGGLAGYSNSGAALDLLAPGGGPGGYVASTSNSGLTTRAMESYAYAVGTSAAAPHVAGAAALMQGLGASTPAQVEAMLKSTARPMPLPCVAPCGAGILNVAAAVGAAAGGALSVDDRAVTEGEGAGVLKFVVSLSKPMPGPVSFDVQALAGTAGASDFVPLVLSGQVIPAGATRAEFSVAILGDAIAEGDEEFTFSVSNVAGIAVADAEATGTILDNDPIVLQNDVWTKVGKLIPGEPWVFLGGGRQALYSIVVPPGRSSLEVRTMSLTGGNGYDVDLLVKAGSPPSFASADCISDSATGNELCTFANPAPGTYYILVFAYADSYEMGVRATFPTDGPPVVNIEDGSVVEGTVQGQALMFRASLSWTTTTPVYFNATTADGTAKDGVDYMGMTRRNFEIPAGATGVDFMVATSGDSEVEGHETLTVNLDTVLNATLGRAQGLGRIINDDFASLRIGDVQVLEGDSGQNSINFVVELSQPMPSPVTFDIATVAGSATAGSDFQARSVTGRYLDAGRTRSLFEVVVNGDATAEADETFSVVISNVVGADLADGTAAATIGNDDPPAARAKSRQRKIRRTR